MIHEGMTKKSSGLSNVHSNDLLSLLNSLLCAVNRVTAPHRHGNRIPQSALDDLSNRQLDIERSVENMTVRPIDDKGQRFFSAVPTENEIQRHEWLKHEAEKKRLLEIKRLEDEIRERKERLDKLLESK